MTNGVTVGRRLRRETFYEAQRRHRRADWVFALLSAVGVSILGVPLSVIVAPFLLIIVLVTMLIVSRTAPTLDLTIIVRVLNRVFNPVTPMDVEQLAVWAGALLIPGIVTTLPAWLLVRRLFLRAGTGAVALAAGARPPNADDLEERQLTTSWRKWQWLPASRLRRCW